MSDKIDNRNDNITITVDKLAANVVPIKII